MYAMICVCDMYVRVYACKWCAAPTTWSHTSKLGNHPTRPRRIFGAMSSRLWSTQPWDTLPCSSRWFSFRHDLVKESQANWIWRKYWEILERKWTHFTLDWCGSFFGCLGFLPDLANNDRFAMFRPISTCPARSWPVLVWTPCGSLTSQWILRRPPAQPYGQVTSSLKGKGFAQPNLGSPRFWGLPSSVPGALELNHHDGHPWSKNVQD